MEKTAAHDHSIHFVAFNHDSTMIVSSSYDSIRVWDAGTGLFLSCLSIPLPPSVHASLLFVAASMDLKAETTNRSVSECMHSVHSLAFGEGGVWSIVSGDADNAIRVWNAESLTLKDERLDAHNSSINSVAYNRTGTAIVSCSDDTTIKLWDAASLELKAFGWSAHSDWIMSVAFNKAGDRIVSGSFDNAIKVWDASTFRSYMESEWEEMEQESAEEDMFTSPRTPQRMQQTTGAWLYAAAHPIEYAPSSTTCT